MPSIRTYRSIKPPAQVPKAGTEVVFRGLIGRKHLNGRTGTVVRHIDGSLEDSTHRCRVEVQGTMQTVKVLARNITEVTPQSRWETENHLDLVETPSDDHLALPTAVKLNVDQGCKLPEDKKAPQPEFKNRICTSKGNQMLGETYAQIQASGLGRDPGRLQHKGLSFFRENVQEEAHPANSQTREARTRDVWMRTMRSGYDWRKDGNSMYVDPFHIPVAQGGHAAHVDLQIATNKDAAEGDQPLHPRLRGLLLDEELEPEEVYESVERGYRELSVFTGANENGICFMKTRDIGGPIRRAAEKEREFARKEKNRDKLLRERAALSVKPAEVRLSSQPVTSITHTSRSSLAEARQEDTLELDLINACHWTSAHAYSRSTQQGDDGLQQPTLPNLTRHEATSSQDNVGDRIELELQQPLQPWNESVVKDMLQSSALDAANGFDYGRALLTAPSDVATDRTVKSPWYEHGELASAMLVTE